MNWKDCLNFSKSSINLITKIFFIAFIFSASVIAQIESSENDTIKRDSVFESTKSPWTAVLMSAVVPGAGQIYNESYWKAPLIWGLTGWLVYNWVDNNKNYKSNRDLYAQTGDEDFRTLRSFYRDQRDVFAIYLGLTYVLNLVDAYVDAQLFDFTVEEDFLIRQPRLNIRFYLR
jgi:hypothetical protein